METEVLIVQVIVFAFLCTMAVIVGRGFVWIWTSKPFLDLKKVIDVQEGEIKVLRNDIAYASKRGKACEDIINRLVRELRNATGENKGRFDLWSEVDEQVERNKKLEKDNETPRWLLPMGDESQKNDKD